MTQQYSRLGRILDGLSSDLWFITIYVAICLRVNETSNFFMQYPWLVWLLGASAGLSHVIQAAMADYYRFIVRKYFEIVPPAQQYGITHWCITDPESGWRALEPAGLWDADYNRKYAYAGFADGLRGKY
jgi:hypothetical protein